MEFDAFKVPRGPRVRRFEQCLEVVRRLWTEEKVSVDNAWGQDTVMPGHESFRQPFEDLLRDRFVLGSPEECYAQLRPCWAEVGANYLILRTHWSGMPVGQRWAACG